MLRKKSGIDRSILKTNPKKKRYSFSSGKRFKYNCCFICKFDSYTQYHISENEITVPDSTKKKLIFKYCFEEKKFLSDPMRTKPKTNIYIKNPSLRTFPKLPPLPDNYKTNDVEQFLNKISKIIRVKNNVEFNLFMKKVKLRYIFFFFILVILILACFFTYLMLNPIFFLITIFLSIIVIYLTKCILVDKFHVLNLEKIEKKIFKATKEAVKEENTRIEHLRIINNWKENISWEIGRAAYWLELWNSEIDQTEQKKPEISERKALLLETEEERDFLKEIKNNKGSFLRSVDEVLMAGEVLVRLDEKYTERIYPSREGHVRHASMFI